MASGVFDLRFEKLMDALVLGVVGGGVVPLDRKLTFSTPVSKGNSADGLIRIR